MSRAMKDSGIPWIGEIPEGWETHRLKSVFASRINGEWGDDAQNDYNDRVCLRIADFDYKRLRFKHCESYTIRNYSKAEENLPYLKNGDILIEKSGGGEKTPVGRAIVYDLEFDKAMYANFMTRLRVKAQINPWFVEYMLSTLYAYGALNVYIKQTTGIQNLDITTMLEEEKIFLPSLAEQQRIAEFLDRKCAEVDEMIALQEQIIEELKAYKQSVITEAVTKGLNPAAPMRDSEIMFVDKIPSHWKETKTLRLLSMPITDGPHETPEGLDDGIPFISADAVSDGYINFNNKWGYISKEYYEECCKKYIPQRQDIYMIKSGASTGRTAIVETDEVFTIWSPLAVFRANKAVILPYFLLYVLRSDSYQKQVESKWSFGTQQNIGMRTLEKLIISYPSISEQQAIADYLDEKCADIDSLIQTKQSKIDSLKEYKKSIIYEYVTGKQEVE